MKNQIAVFFFISLFSIMNASAKKDISILKKQIDSLLQNHQGTFAIAFKETGSGVALYLNEKENFHAASTMKTPVMIEVFKQAKEKKFSLDDSIVVENSFKSIVDGSPYSMSLSDDSEDGLYSQIGKRETIRNLVFKMITVSSNLATNILIEKVGAENVMNTLRSMNVNDMRVLRGVEDGKAFQAGKNNTTTAYDLSLVFEHLFSLQTVSADANKEMIDILLSQKFKSMIPGKLPNGVKVAHKTGSITNVQHDSGIVYLPDGRSYVLVILSKNLKSNKEGIEVIASISKMIYDFVVN